MRVERIGDCELWLGDMLEVLPTLGGFGACVTDAPFGISDAPLKSKGGHSGRRGAVNTWHPPSEWDRSIEPTWGLVCDAAPVVAWFGQWRKRGEVEAIMRWPLRAEIVWAKDCHVGPPRPVASRDERIWIFAEKGVKGATFETSVWDQPIIPTWAHKNHKNEKPVPLMKRLLDWLSPSSVVDPFMGSGSTLVAAVHRGIRAVGIEQKPEHFDAACQRVEEAVRQPRDMFVKRPAPPTQEALL